MATKDFNFKINGIEQVERVSGSLKDNFEALPTYVKETTEHKNEVRNAKQNKAIGNVIKTGITYIPLVGPTISNFMNAYDTVSDFAQIGETEGVTSHFDKTKEQRFYKPTQLQEYNNEQIAKRKSKINQLRREQLDEEALYLEMETRELEKLEQVEVNKRNSIHELNQTYSKFGQTHSFYQKRMETITDSYNKQVKDTQEDTLEEYYNRGIMGTYGDTIIEGSANRQKQNSNEVKKAPTKQSNKKEDTDKKLRQLREQGNLELDEQEFFQQKSLLSTESFNDRKDELLGEAQQSMAAFANATQSTNDTIIESTDDTAVSFEEKWKGIHETLQKHVDTIMTGVNAIFSGMNSILSDQLEEAKEKYDAITEKYDEVVEQREASSSRLNELEE